MAIAADTLDVYIAGYRVGELRQLSAGKLSFSYDDRWMNGRIAIPLSSSMPTLVKTHEGKAVEAFLWGLLPDNEQTVAGGGPRGPGWARHPNGRQGRAGPSASRCLRATHLPCCPMLAAIAPAPSSSCRMVRSWSARSTWRP